MSPAPPTGFAARKRADHLAGAIRPRRPTVEPAHRRHTATTAAAAAQTLAPGDTQPQRRDGAARLGALVPLDASNRVFAKKAIDALGWTPDTGLVAEVRGATAVIRAGVRTRSEAWLLPTRVDASARLRLPPGVKGALQIGTGDQVVVCAVPATGELHIAAAADMLQTLTGALADPEAVAAATPPRPTGATRVRPAAVFPD